jgi:cysteine desulfurase
LAIVKKKYLDNAATTKPWPEAVEAMNRALREGFGNASSLHSRGVQASKQVAGAALEIERAVGSGSWKVVFTSGGSESVTMAVLGSAPKGKRDKVVTSTLEHAAVSESCKRVFANGGRIVEISAGISGVIDPSAVADATDERTALVSIIHVANEMGTIQPIEEIAKLVKAKFPKCRLHVDAVQALAQLTRLDYPEQVDMVSLSAHKIHGPQGVGALLLRPGVSVRPLICGGDQQSGLRPGTLNLPGISGFGAAAQVLSERRKLEVERMRELTDRLINEIASQVDGVRTLGDPQKRAPGLAVLAVDRVQSEVLINALDARGVQASSNSACHSTRSRPPQSLLDAGLRRSEGAVRLSLSFDTTADEIESAVRCFVEAVLAVRAGKAG